MTKKQPKKIKASRELQGKVGIGQIDADKIAAAQKLMDADETDFGTLAHSDLSKLQKAIDAAKDIDDGDAVLASFREPIMNLKANAGAFKYGFVSGMTGTVLMFLETIERPDKKVVQIVDILHKTILLALAYQMKGDGGKNGAALQAAFEAVCKKYKPVKIQTGKK